MEKLSKDLEESSNKPDIRAKGKIGWKLKIAIMSAFSILVAFMIISPTVSGPIYSNPWIIISVSNIDENMSCYLLLLGGINNTTGVAEEFILHPGENHTVCFTGERGNDVEVMGFACWGNESFIDSLSRIIFKMPVTINIGNYSASTSLELPIRIGLLFLGPDFDEKVNDIGQQIYNFSFSINSQQWIDRLSEREIGL
jgi:hypothetical protein